MTRKWLEGFLVSRTRALMLLASISTMLLIVSNLASVKITNLGPVVFDSGTLIFPLVYIITGVVTEIYGSKTARLMVWISFACLIFLSVFLLGVQYLPADIDPSRQEAYEQILGFVPRLVGASLTAYLIGEMINIFVVDKLRHFAGQHSLWTRLVSSSGMGELVDTIIFSLIAFLGTMPFDRLLQLMLSVYVIKLSVAIILSPLTLKFTHWMRNLKEEAESTSLPQAS